jgi:hypothetical protein
MIFLKNGIAGEWVLIGYAISVPSLDLYQKDLGYIRLV